MILFPAIDIKAGKVVRLQQGDYQKVTEYPESPLAQAKRWADEGATWLHMVDLDAAKAGHPVNGELIAQVARESGLKVQIGGGIRNLAMAGDYLKRGVSRIVVGTAAVNDLKFLAELGRKFPGQVALGLDTKEGKIAVQGWTETTDLTIEEFLSGAPLEGIACLIFTDIARDGMLSGPNLKALREVLALSPIPVIASGGIAKAEDLEAIRNLKDSNLLGAIVGKALYEGRLSLAEALRALTPEA